MLGSHILVITPLSANTLAETVHGMSDNLLTLVIRAWDTDGSIDLPGSGTPKRVKRSGGQVGSLLIRENGREKVGSRC